MATQSKQTPSAESRRGENEQASRSAAQVEMRARTITPFKRGLRRFFKPMVMTCLYLVRFRPDRAFQMLKQRRLARERSAGQLVEFKIDDRVVVSVRAGTHDIDIFEQIFLLRDCAGPRGIRPQLIIDGGAHVGYSAVSFALRYPHAQIIAVEANKDNYDLLKLNAAAFRNIKCVHAAIWGANERVTIANPSDDSWGFRVQSVNSSNKDASVQGITIDELLASSGSPRIGLLKLDIEGAERKVFSAQYESWLSKTDTIIIELHDRFQAGCSEAFFSAIGKFNFNLAKRTANNVIVTRPV